MDTLARLLDATRRLASVRDETSVVQTIADGAMTVFETPGAALFIGSANTGVLAGVSGCCAALPAGVRLSPTQTALWTRVAAGTTIAVTNSDEVPGELQDQQPALVLPLGFDEQVVGWLWLPSARPASVGPSAARLFAAQAAGALDNARRYRELVEANQRKDAELATLAHELRTPLAAITHALAALDRFATAEEQVIRLRDLIGRQARHLARLVEDYLDVARLRHGKLALRRQPVDLCAIVRRALEAVAAAGRGRDQDVRAHLPETSIVVHGDATRLEQVVRNLLDNAVKYSPPHTTIDVSVEQADGAAILGVRDEGIGIAPALLPRLFEPYAQGERAGPLAAGGLGLGLPLVRAVVEQHGGTVTAHSAGAGHGSVFIVRLPVPA